MQQVQLHFRRKTTVSLSLICVTCLLTSFFGASCQSIEERINKRSFYRPTSSVTNSDTDIINQSQLKYALKLDNRQKFLKATGYTLGLFSATFITVGSVLNENELIGPGGLGGLFTCVVFKKARSNKLRRDLLLRQNSFYRKKRIDFFFRRKAETPRHTN